MICDGNARLHFLMSNVVHVATISITEDPSQKLFSEQKFLASFFDRKQFCRGWEREKIIRSIHRTRQMNPLEQNLTSQYLGYDTTNEPDLTNSGLQRWLIPWLITLMSVLVIKRQRTNRITAKLHDKQCDHMAKLSLQYWANNNNANLPNSLQICPTQSAPNFDQYKINPQIIARDC